MKILIDDFDNKGQEVDHPYSEWSDDDLVNAILNNDPQAKEEFDKRVELEVMADMKAKGISATTIKTMVSEAKAVEATLTKAHRERIDLALATLEALPDCVDKPGHLDVPWPQTVRPKVADEQWAKANLGHVHIQDLTATQPYLRRETVVYHIMSPGSPGEHKRAFANVIRQDGKELIYDGHHRLAALWLLGAEVSNTWILE